MWIYILLFIKKLTSSQQGLLEVRVNIAAYLSNRGTYYLIITTTSFTFFSLVGISSIFFCTEPPCRQRRSSFYLTCWIKSLSFIYLFRTHLGMISSDFQPVEFTSCSSSCKIHKDFLVINKQTNKHSKIIFPKKAKIIV